MITSMQFDDALKIIADYKSQLEIELIQDNSKVRFINIQKGIKKKTFFLLQNYYKDKLNENLKWSDLKTMKIAILQNLDYAHLRRYRGFGKVGERKLKELVESFVNKAD